MDPVADGYLTIDRIRNTTIAPITRHTILHIDENGWCVEMKPKYFRYWYKVDDSGKCSTDKIEEK